MSLVPPLWPGRVYLISPDEVSKIAISGSMVAMASNFPLGVRDIDVIDSGSVDLKSIEHLGRCCAKSSSSNSAFVMPPITDLFQVFLYIF